MILEKRTPGETIREIRKIRGITQKEIAENLGTTIAAVSRYESGQRQMSVERFEEILDILKASYFIRF